MFCANIFFVQIVTAGGHRSLCPSHAAAAAAGIRDLLAKHGACPAIIAITSPGGVIGFHEQLYGPILNRVDAAIQGTSVEGIHTRQALMTLKIAIQWYRMIVNDEPGLMNHFLAGCASFFKSKSGQKLVDAVLDAFKFFASLFGIQMMVVMSRELLAESIQVHVATGTVGLVACTTGGLSFRELTGLGRLASANLQAKESGCMRSKDWNSANVMSSHCEAIKRRISEATLRADNNYDNVLFVVGGTLLVVGLALIALAVRGARQDRGNDSLHLPTAAQTRAHHILMNHLSQQLVVPVSAAAAAAESGAAVGEEARAR